jgi:hypothetical protein
MRKLLLKFKLAAAFAVAIGLVIVAVPNISLAADVPTGEVTMGHGQLEPAYDDLTGKFMYLLTPLGTPVVDKANPHATAPLYIIVYPTTTKGAIGTVNCQHQPMDNCPDHGPGIAGLAESAMPSVYPPLGVWGHDHIGTGHPSTPPLGGDYNTAWVPTAVLFTSVAAANNHITTLSQLNAAIASHDVILISLPSATFQCSPVAAQVYNMGTPVTPGPALP